MRGDISQLKSQIVSWELKADEKYVISSDQRVSEDTSNFFFDDNACVESEPHMSLQKLKESMEETRGS
jgi:hypothetical protein